MRRALCALGATLLLAAAAARGDQTPPRSAAEDPDLGFLEFLGSVDGLAETNPDYLAQAQPPGSPPVARVRLPPPAPSPPDRPPAQEKKND